MKCCKLRTTYAWTTLWDSSHFNFFLLWYFNVEGCLPSWGLMDTSGLITNLNLSIGGATEPLWNLLLKGRKRGNYSIFSVQNKSFHFSLGAGITAILMVSSLFTMWQMQSPLLMSNVGCMRLDKTVTMCARFWVSGFVTNLSSPHLSVQWPLAKVVGLCDSITLHWNLIRVIEMQEIFFQ